MWATNGIFMIPEELNSKRMTQKPTTRGSQFRYRKLVSKLTAFASLVFAVFLISGDSAAEDFVVTHDLVPLAKPGDVVNDAPPAGWSNLVIKSCPQANAGDVDGLSKTDMSLTSKFRTVTLANVEERIVDGHRQYQLSRVGLALCVPVQRKGDVMVTPESQKESGANLGFLGRTVLGKIFSEFDKVHFVARSDSAAIYDSPVVMRYDGKNREMIIRYALIVRQSDGRLDTMGWVIELNKDGGHERLASKVQWMPQNHIIRCGLYVDSSEYTFGIPSKRAFGVVTAPQGKVQFTMPKHLTEIGKNETLTAEEADQLVSSIRKIIAFYDKKEAQGK